MLDEVEQVERDDRAGAARLAHRVVVLRRPPGRWVVGCDFWSASFQAEKTYPRGEGLAEGLERLLV